MKKLQDKPERVEVMALFGYEMTPCQPLSFIRSGGKEVEVTELLATRIKFEGTTAIHIFDVVANQRKCRLEFNGKSLAWDVATY